MRAVGERGAVGQGSEEGLSRKTEHRDEHRDIAQQLDAIAIPLVEEIGVDAAYRAAVEKLAEAQELSVIK